MILAPRRSDMSREQFRRYVTEVHGPLVRSVPEVAADIRHYHYNFPVIGSVDPLFAHPPAGALDIVTQGWFDSLAAQLANMARPRYLQIVRPDEGRFADAARAIMHYTTETVIVPSTPAIPPRKLFLFRRRRSDLRREDFQDAWRTRFRTAMAELLAGQGAFCGYLQNHTLPERDHPAGSSTKYFDVIDELSVPAPDALALCRPDRAALARVQALEAELLEPACSRSLVTETVVNIP